MVSNTPPFSRMVLITASSYDEKESISIVKKLVETAPTLAGVDVLGPSPAPLLGGRRKPTRGAVWLPVAGRGGGERAHHPDGPRGQAMQAAGG